MTGSQIKTQLSKIIDSLIIDTKPETLADDLPDLLADGDRRNDAIASLIQMIEFYRDSL